MDENKESLNVSDLGASLPALATGLSGEDRAGLISDLKNIKLQSLAGLHSDMLENLNPKDRKRKRVELLREIQSQHDEHKSKFFEERAVLDAKYQKLYEPLYKKRYEIVNGVVEVESVAKENAEETKTDGEDSEAIEDKGLPGFWLTAMKTNDVLTEEIQKRDEKALKFLKDIKWSRIDDPKGFKLEFLFDSNPYFKNSVLTKTYHMIDDDKLEKAIGTEFEWYPGKCLTQKILNKTSAMSIPKTKYCESFFNFFNTLQVPEDDEEIAEELQNQMKQDYDIGSAIRDEIIPHAVSWFTGEAAHDDNIQDLVGEDEGEDNDEDEEEDDDDEEEDSKSDVEECFTEIYYLCPVDMSGQKHHLRNPQMSAGYTQQEYHEPRPPTWGPPGGSQMQSQMSGAYTRQGYHEPRPPTWGPPGGSQMQQQPGYGYMQPGSYPTQPQYYMYQPAYGGYPTSYPLQSSNQQTATGIGYDYYGQQQQPQQQPDGGSAASADNNSYNYSQPPPNYSSQGSYGDHAYSQPTSGQQQGYGQDGYSGGYQAHPAYAQPSSTTQFGYDHQQGYGSNPAYPPQDGSAPAYGTQGVSTQVPPTQQAPPPVQASATQQGYTGQPPSSNAASFPSQPGYGSQVPAGGNMQSPTLTPPTYVQPPQGQKLPPAQLPPTSQAGYAQSGYMQPPPAQSGYPQVPLSSGYGSAGPQPGYGQAPTYGSVPPQGQGYGGAYSQPLAYSTESAAHGAYDAPSSSPAVPTGVAKTSPQS